MVGGEHCSRRHSWVSESQTVANLANSNLKKCDVYCVQIYVYLMMMRYWGNHTTKIFPLDPNPKCNTWKMFIPMYVQRVQFLESSKQILPGLSNLKKWITIKIPTFIIPTFIIPKFWYFEWGIGILIGALVFWTRHWYYERVCIGIMNVFFRWYYDSCRRGFVGILIAHWYFDRSLVFWLLIGILIIHI